MSILRTSLDHIKKRMKKGKIPSTFSICSLLNSRRHCSGAIANSRRGIADLPSCCRSSREMSLMPDSRNDSALAVLNLGCRVRLLITQTARGAVEKQNARAFVGISFQWVLLMLAVVHYSSYFFPSSFAPSTYAPCVRSFENPSGFLRARSPLVILEF